MGYIPAATRSFLVTLHGENLPETKATVEKSRVERCMEEFLDKIESLDPAIPEAYVGQKHFLILCKPVQALGFCPLQCRMLSDTGQKDPFTSGVPRFDEIAHESDAVTCGRIH